MIPLLNPNIWKQTQLNDPVVGFKPHPQQYVQDAYIQDKSNKQFLRDYKIPSTVPNVYSYDTISNNQITDIQQNPVSVMAINKMKSKGDIDNIEDLLDRKITLEEINEVAQESQLADDDLVFNLFNFRKGLDENKLRRLLKTLLDRKIRYNVKERQDKYQVYTADKEIQENKEPMIETEISIKEREIETENPTEKPILQEMKESKFGSIRTMTQLKNMTKDELIELATRLDLEIDKNSNKNVIISKISETLNISTTTPSKRKEIEIKGEGLRKKKLKI